MSQKKASFFHLSFNTIHIRLSRELWGTQNIGPLPCLAQLFERTLNHVICSTQLKIMLTASYCRYIWTTSIPNAKRYPLHLSALPMAVTKHFLTSLAWERAGSKHWVINFHFWEKKKRLYNHYIILYILEYVIALVKIKCLNGVQLAYECLW